MTTNTVAALRALAAAASSNAPRRRRRVRREHEVRRRTLERLQRGGAGGGTFDLDMAEEFVQPLRDGRARLRIGLHEQDAHARAWQPCSRFPGIGPCAERRGYVR
jgi:hypothetical protein